MRRSPLVLAAVVTMALAGCGDDGTAPAATTPPPTMSSAPTTPPAITSSPSPTSTATRAPAPTATATATESPLSGDGTSTPFPANTDPDTGDPEGEPSTVADVRVGLHEGYDRVVFDADGGGTPGWTVEYVDEAFAQGSGEPVEVAGNAILQVILTNTAYPMDTGVDEFAGDLEGDGDIVTQVRFIGTYEGQSQAFIGLEEQRPFRVRALGDDEGRVLVEIWH